MALRVAQVVGKMVGGGMESVVMNYYANVNRDIIQFDFLVDSDSTLIPRDEIELRGGRVFVIPPYQHVLAYQKALRGLFDEYRWPIVHSHENALSVFPLCAARAAGVPIRIAHSHSTSNPEERLRTAIKNLLKTQANLYPTERFACGRLAGEWLFGTGSEFWIMPNAINLRQFTYSPEKRAMMRRELGIDDHVFVVLHMGRFVQQKNHDLLIDIFEALLHRRKNAMLLLAGDGPLRAEIEHRVASAGMQDSVRFLGQRSDAPALYSAADCFCLPSLYEGLPVVSVEAQASGLPLIMSTDVSSEAVITSRTKTLSRLDGPEVWADALNAVELSTRVKELSEADNEAMQRYDCVIQGKRLTEKYIELAKKAGVRVE